MPNAAPNSRTRGQMIGLLAGPALFLAMCLVPAPEGLSREGWICAALTVLMVTWWVSEALPIGGTALAPLVVLPLSGVSSLRDAAVSYMSPIVVLLMAGFIIARAIEKWGLHERIALLVIERLGARPPALIAGFMIASAGLSMWISNTATALMMTPIALSVGEAMARGAGCGRSLQASLLLAVAYACSIGGLATPVGSPTNLIVIGFLAERGIDVAFTDWMRLGLPVVLIMAPCAWGVLTRAARSDGQGPMDPAAGRAVIAEARARLGPARAPEIRTLMLFAVTAAAWMFSRPLAETRLLAGLNDQVIAVASAILFFVLPSGAPGARSAPLLDWESAERIPWGVVLLFGGGLSLAAAIAKTGLAAFLAGAFAAFGDAPDLLVILAVTALVLMLTEFTSNVATVSALLPMIGALATAMGADLLTLAAPAGLAASCAFMLPMATGPNAVAYATGCVSMGRMVRTGVAINLIAVAVITLWVGALAPQG